MSDVYNTQKPLYSIARDYFDYLGSHLPIECANDEFYFIPRSRTAIQHLNKLDDLSPYKIQDLLTHVNRLLREAAKINAHDLEEEIDCVLLTQSMESFVREFEEDMVWSRDPTLYLKIPLFATDLCMSQRDLPVDQRKEYLSALLEQIPSFLDQGIQNLISPTEISLQVASDMVQDALHFYNKELRLFASEKIGDERELSMRINSVVEACERFGTDLSHLPFLKSPARGEEALKRILSVSLRYHKSPDEILKIVQDSYREILEKLIELAKKIDNRKAWIDIVYEHLPSMSSPTEIMELYTKEVQDLRRFLSSRDIVPLPSKETLAVIQTPVYLQSLRATASYRAPLTRDLKSLGIFYITPGKDDLELISAHCPYLTAHETYPGHHILDHFRIHNSNPIRCQIESPLFYEGWACYAEQLLDECGYIQEPRTQLIQLKRQLWRNVRAMLDVKIHTGKITLRRAAREIENLGFSSQRAHRQVRRFALTPGYQLCYAMGTHEILELRKRFAPAMGLKLFHDILLNGGEAPFHLIEKRLEAWNNKTMENRANASLETI
jgi:uncharacterized protein (DUF885 family)